MTKRPNFLIIVADDLGFSDVGAFGGEIKTPHIDDLAKNGIRFTDFHAAAACSPTRSMLLSGTDNHIAGLGAMRESLQDYQTGKPGYEGYLNDDVATLSELLQEGGYYTLMSGKWHLGLTPDRWPSKRGFDRSFSLLPGAANHYGWEPQLLADAKKPRFMANNTVFYVEDDQPIEAKDLGEDFYSSEAFATKLIEYLDQRSQNKDEPFFAYLPFSAPHWPLQAPEDDIEEYQGLYDAGPEILRQNRLKKLKELGLIPEDAAPHDVVAVDGYMLSREWDNLKPEERCFSARTMEIYAGMVQNMDTQIGRVLEKLRSNNELNNTFILFMSDNGAEGLLLEALPIIQGGVHEYIEKYHDNSISNLGRKNSYIWYGPHWASAATAPSRLYKSFISEGGIRVPLIINYPPLTSNAHTRFAIDHSFGTVMDVAPTILELAGIKHPYPTYRSRPIHPVRGTSWVPYLSQKTPRIHKEEKVVGWELFGRMAIRKGDWKALYIPKPYGPEKWQLYYLKEDPGETIDLAEKETKKFGELMEEWENDESDIESCFDTEDEQEETDTETEPTDDNTDVDGDDEADLPDLEWLTHSDNAYTVPIDVDTNVNGDNEIDLAWIAREENAYPPEYYLDQENNSDESENEDENYSDGSFLFLDMIEGNFHR